MASTKDKSFWILLVFILSGLVIGGLLGEIASKVPSLWWLGYSQQFGMAQPVNLDFKVLTISFGLLIKINLASIIGVAIALIIYRKL